MNKMIRILNEEGMPLIRRPRAAKTFRITLENKHSIGWPRLKRLILEKCEDFNPNKDTLLIKDFHNLTIRNKPETHEIWDMKEWPNAS